MGFADIIGQQKPLATLRSALAAGRVHHAYLFLGPEGVGKRAVAVAFAKAIHCAELTNDFCGDCADCSRIADGNHPDVRVIEPLAGKKEISIQQIRNLQRELSYRSFTGMRKIAIVDPATLMNAPGQNALLKTLEEPPQDSLIILIAANVGGLLPTLRSRCLQLTFAPLTRKEVSGFLISRHGMNGTDAELVAALALGSIGAALAFNKEELIEQRRNWTGALSSLRVGDYRGAMMAAETLSSQRDEMLKFLQWAESWYRDLLVQKAAQGTGNLVNVDLREQIDERAANSDLQQTLRAISQIEGAAARVQRNLNRRMVLERFFFGVVGER
ncbi:MAG TPA: DNA polymerase III subunit delta' [Candidatus Binatia bacterium]|nr:DNA polymerase III subunit delta' [Candidatus Binatia bacterium]